MKITRISDKQLKKLRDNFGYKGTISRPTPRWSPGSRKSKKLATAWNKAIENRIHVPIEIVVPTSRLARED